MRRLRVLRKADGFDDIDLRLETCEPPARGRDELLIEVRAAGEIRHRVGKRVAVAIAGGKVHDQRMSFGDGLCGDGR